MFSILKEKRELDLRARSTISKSKHFIFDRTLGGPFPPGTKKIMLGMGCFWGVEKLFWNLTGVEMTAVGYSGGTMANPSYEDVCSKNTGHNEVLLLHYNPSSLKLKEILTIFWEGHNPTQGMRQGNDIGSQYRSGIYIYDDDDYSLAIRTRSAYGKALKLRGFNEITTEVLKADQFYYAEGYHQQYLAKNPNGYCGLGGTGVCL